MHRRDILIGGAALLAAAAGRAPASSASRPEAAAAAPRLEAMIGQLIMVGFRGAARGDPWIAAVEGQIAAGTVGGVMHLGYNLRDRAAVVEMNGAFAAAPSDHPALIAVDQEGGRVARLTAWHGFAETPSARNVAASMDARAARDAYARLASDLAAWGFNLNLAPVVDLDIDSQSPAIGALARSFSADPRVVADYAAAFVHAHREAGVLTCLKHFPGHGSANADSHATLPDVSESWSRRELDPFRDMIACGLADAVMVGHLFNERLQGEDRTEPATLSPRIVGDLLRGELGFGGVVVTDDLQMRAVTASRSMEETVIGAVLAGCDLLLFANYEQPDLGLPHRVADILAREAEASPDLAVAIEASWRRVVGLKRRPTASVPGG